MSARSLAFLLSLVFFTVVFLRNAWVVDDAYITFRTVENFVAGHGLVWNLDERVQVYSHPLWMFVLSSARLFGADLFYASIALSYALCLGTLVVAERGVGRREEWWRPVLLVVGFAASKAAMDYSSSGLENALSYFLAALFVSVYWPAHGDADPRSAERRLFWLCVIASFATFNRQDTQILYLPVLVALLLQQRQRPWPRTIRLVALGTLPASCWIAFATFYYGSPFPNTALAKAFGTGVPILEKVERGFEYLGNSLAWDPVSHALVVGVALLAWRQRSRPAFWLLAGIATYGLYIVTSAAAATHMSGRFVALPAVIALLLGVRLLPGQRWAAASAAVLLAGLLLNPHSPLRMGTSFYADSPQDPDHIDTNLFVHREGASLLDYFEGRPLPDHDWYHAGLAFRDRAERVSVGADGGAAIGYFAFAAGPRKFIVDYAALTDPLLSRLPACNISPPGSWRSGHFFRSIPPGYLESVRTGENRIEDAGLRTYYEKVRSLTRAPLFSPGRLRDIFEMNLDVHAGLKAEYLHQSAGRCRIPMRRLPTLSPSRSRE